MRKMCGRLDTAWPQMSGGRVIHKNVMTVKITQDQIRLFLVTLLTTAMLISIFTAPVARAAEPHPLGGSAKHMSSRPLGDFLGKWKAQDGKDLLVISPQKIVSTSWRKDDAGKPEKYTGEARWSNLDSDSNEAETFGLRKKRTTLAEISKQYETALKEYRQGRSDFSVSDPKLSRKAILAMSPGSYQILWSYSGGDAGEEYIADKDHLLKIYDGAYGFSVTLYGRVK